MYRIKVACIGKGGKLEVIEFDAPKPSVCYGKAKWQGKRIQAVVKRPICYFCGNDFAKEKYTARSGSTAIASLAETIKEVYMEEA